MSSPAKRVTWGGGPMQISQVGATALVILVPDHWPFQCAYCLKCQRLAQVFFIVHLQCALSNAHAKEYTQISYKFSMISMERKIHLYLNKSELKGYSSIPVVSCFILLHFT